MSPLSTTRSGCQTVELGDELGAPLLARVELAPRDEERGDAVLLGVREAVGLAVGADDDDRAPGSRGPPQRRAGPEDSTPRPR